MGVGSKDTLTPPTHFSGVRTPNSLPTICAPGSLSGVPEYQTISDCCRKLEREKKHRNQRKTDGDRLVGAGRGRVDGAVRRGVDFAEQVSLRLVVHHLAVLYSVETQVAVRSTIHRRTNVTAVSHSTHRSSSTTMDAGECL